MQRRFTIAIAEDEERIRILVKALIDWENLPIDLLWEASNGSEALRALSQKPVDILITDIKMPGLNGLELAKWIHSTNSSISIIVVSGYKHFEYVHDALRLNVVDYLLKPIKADELNGAIRKTIDQSSSSSAQETQIRQMESSLRKQFMADILSSKLKADSDFSELCGKYCLPFSADRFLIFAIQFFDSNIQLEEYLSRFTEEKDPYDSSFSDKLIGSVDMILERMGYASVSDFIGDTLYCVVNFDTKASKTLKLALESILEKLNTQMDFLYTSSIMAVSEIVDEVGELPLQNARIHSLLNCHCVLNTPIAFTSDYSNTRKQTFPDLSGEIRHALEIQDPLFLIGKTKSLFSTCRNCVEASPYLFEQLIDCILSPFWHALADQQNHLPEDFFNADLYKKFICSVSKDYSEACSNTVVVEQKIFDRLVQKNRATYSSPVKSVIAYLNAHYSEPLSLNDLANEVQLNPSYLSNLFSTEVGMTLSIFLQDIRIEQAKQLLLTTSWNISEIAYKVGYNDEKYFSRIFKKSVGVGPKDYRKLNKWR